jgi:23S rRNA pseudouridine2605 synthase
MERLQKIISAAGVASRRKAEELITSGLVQVNGQTITELGAKADAGKDHIRVNGKLIKFSGHHVYILLNKPKGYVTTLSDPEGRPTIVDLLQGVKQRVYPVGRLDYASEGLLLLTNDGEMANALTKAASHVPKTYLVKVSGQPSDAAIEQLRAGIELPDRKGIHSRTAPAGIQLVHKSENPWYEVTLIEGRNRQIRAMFEQTGHHVEKLKRVRYGPFTLDVHPGKHRNLTLEEVEQLRSAVQRGANATAEDSVRPAARATEPADSHIETALREEGRSPVQVQPAPATLDKPKRSPKPLGTFTPKPRFGAPRPQFARPGSARPGGDRAGKKPGTFGGDKFRKKGPVGVKFSRESAPFQKRGFDSGPRPVRPAGAGTRPEWKKTADSRGGSPRPTGRAGGPKKWEPRTTAPERKPRLFGKDDSRPVRPSTGGRPDWKKFAPRSFAPGAPQSGDSKSGDSRPSAPRKWTQGAASANARPRPFEKKPGAFGSRPDRPSKPFGKPRREDSRGEQDRGTGAHPPRPGSERKPFWQGANKRRSRKPKEEGGVERSEGRSASQGSGRRSGREERPRKPAAGGFSRPKFGASKPPSKFGKKRR